MVQNAIEPSCTDLQLRAQSGDQSISYKCEPGSMEALAEPKLSVVRQHQTSDEQARPVKL